ncbi:hypothetical protein [Pseudoxanthomonas suwonensis]|nr:hypothetical protein [Pseudoxanthomonas suwonensis]
MKRFRATVAFLSAFLTVAACAALFAAWLHPRVVAAWLGAWITALCG